MLEKHTESTREISDAEITKVVNWLGLGDTESLQNYLSKFQTREELLHLQERVGQHPLAMHDTSLKYELLKLCFTAAQKIKIKAVLKPTQGEENFIFVPEGFPA